MKQRISDDSGDYVTVEAGEDSIAADGDVRLFAPATENTISTGEPVAVLSFSPARARELAAALLRAADEAEERTPSTPERDLLAFLSRAGWDGTDMVAAVRAQIVRETRDEVARDLEQMDGTNLGMSLVRTQAVRVARSGLEPMDVRRGA
ncbi:hypothetical protein [Streptomyces sparsogenes]|uniref:hypothetical protein n=1 Tax=Streptomyces sparsogenes TaxID=67365 RepID=UPI00340161CD